MCSRYYDTSPNNTGLDTYDIINDRVEKLSLLVTWPDRLNHLFNVSVSYLLFQMT